MLIRDLELETGLDRATIRFYEREGLITPQRQENGYRDYTEHHRDTLLKIKLLRQLGVSLERLKALEAGENTLAEVLDSQLAQLDAQREQLQRSRAVCAQMREDGSRFDSLDARHYLALLEQPQEPQKPPTVFSECTPREYHPIRRFAARMMDYALLWLIVEFLIVVVLRIRVVSTLWDMVLDYGLLFLSVPLQAWMLHKWGTTPGKWVMELSVPSEDGRFLDYSSALNREKDVLKLGLGYGIPGYSLYRLYRSWQDYGDWEPEWDWECEYTYQIPSPRQKGILAAGMALCALLSIVTIRDQFLPRYRGDLTVAQFAANYNYYLELLEDDVDDTQKLTREGKHTPRDSNTTVYIWGEPENPAFDFTYTLEGSYLTKISYENRWTNAPIILLCLFAGFWPKPAFFPGIMPHRGTCCAWNSFWKNSWARRRGISALGKWRCFGRSRERISSMPATGSISFLKATWAAAWQYNSRSAWEPNKQWGQPCGSGVSGIHECAVATNRAAEQQCSSGEILRGTAEKGIRKPPVEENVSTTGGCHFV